MKNYVLKIATDALNDIQEIIDWYKTKNRNWEISFIKEPLNKLTV